MLPLAALAYDNASLKHAIDIDLLVDPGDLKRAADLLAARGFELIEPSGADDSRLERWHRHRKDSEWLARGLRIDLHSRPADNSGLLPGLDVRSPRQLVDIGNNIQLPTFAMEGLFAHLSVHGASSAWFRLKWISDFAGLLARADPGALDDLYRCAHTYRASRAAGQGLLLADTLLGSLEELPKLRARLLGDRLVRRLHRAALRQLLRQTEPTASALGTWTIHWTQFLLCPGIAFKASELTRQVRAALA